MAKYRKKPVVIEAFKYGDNYSSIPVWAKKAKDREITFYSSCELGRWAEIKTLEGVMRAEIGDYIIKGVKGEIYPCKSDIFEMTYELVEE